MPKVIERTSQKIEALEYAFSIGCNVLESCLYAGIGKSTYYRWIEGDEDLRDRFELLQTKTVLKSKEVVKESLDEGDINTAKWVLERRSDEYKNKSESTVTKEVTHKTLADYYDEQEEGDT